MSLVDAVADMLAAKVRHAKLLESRMMGLLPRVRRGDQEAKKEYEWYMQAAKAISLKDVLAFAKLAAEGEEVMDSFDGFEDD